MNDLLLQTVVEKLEDIELLVRDNDQNKTGEELKKISEELKILSVRTISSERVNELIKSLNACTSKLEGQVQNTIEHRHHLHKGIWIAIVLFIANIFLFTGWINSYNSSMQFRANDYKYRALKTMKDESLKKALYNIDSLYKINPEYFEKKVIEKEGRFLKDFHIILNRGMKIKEK
jgi:hypothetical protein